MVEMMIQKVYIGVTVTETDRITLTKCISNKLIREMRKEKKWPTGSGSGGSKWGGRVVAPLQADYSVAMTDRQIALLLLQWVESVTEKDF